MAFEIRLDPRWMLSMCFDLPIQPYYDCSKRHPHVELVCILSHDEHLFYCIVDVNLVGPRPYFGFAVVTTLL